MWLRSAIVSLALGAPLAAQQNDQWRQPFPPFKLIGNVYWVGTYDLSTYLIATDAGHILVNTGFPDTVPLIAAGVEQLGFEMADVKFLLATHAHGDHVAGLAELKRLTGAQVLMSEADAVLLEDGGSSDFRFGDGRTPSFEPVQVDRRLADQDTVALGGVTLTAHHHPGHTKGATSFAFTVREAGRDYRVVIANLGSINPGVTVSGMPKYPTIGDDYARTFAAQKALPVDVFLASHAAQFGMHEKYRPGDPYDPNRFVDPAGYRAAVERLEGVYRAQLARERAAAPQSERPDFTGVWTTYRGSGGAGGTNTTGAQPKLTPEGQARSDLYRRVTTGTNYTPGGYCVGSGMPASMLGSGGYPMEIIQRPDQITVIYEAHNEIRRIYFGERVPEAQSVFPERNGRSVGRWEDDTLVVETDRLVEQVDTRYPHSDEARIVERYRLSTEADGRKVITATLAMTDPVFLTEPFTVEKKWQAVPNGRLLTYECTEPEWLDVLDRLMSEAAAAPGADRR